LYLYKNIFILKKYIITYNIISLYLFYFGLWLSRDVNNLRELFRIKE